MRRSILLFIFLLALPLYARAVALPDTLHTRRYLLDELRVIATSPEISAGHISVIHKDQKEKATELHITDIISHVPGLSISTGSRGESDLRIRGFKRDQVKIMVDGRQVNGGYFGNVNLSEIPIFDIDEVHILKGAVSSVYGVNSSGGVVNFISRKPSKESWLTLKSTIGRNNTQSMQAVASHSFDIWDFWVNLSGYRTDGFMLSKKFSPTQYENGFIRDMSDNSSIDIQTKINFSLLDLHSIGFSAGYTFADKRNVPSSIYEARYRQFTDWRRYHVSALASFQVTPYLTIHPNVYYDAYDNTYLEWADRGLTNLILDSILESWTFGSIARSEYILSDKTKLYHFYNYEKQLYNRKDNQGYVDWTTNFTHLHNTSLMCSHRLNQKWSSSVAIGTALHTRHNRNGEDIRSGWDTEYSAGLRYDDHINSLNLAYSKNIHYPNMHQLYSLSRGNKYLLPETAYKAEITAGRKFLLPSFTLSTEVSAFHNQLYDMIDRVDSPMYKNHHIARNAGFELSLLSHLSKHIQLEHNLSYINLHLDRDYDFYEIPAITQYNTIYITIIDNLIYSYSINYTGKIKSLDERGRLRQLPSRTIHSSGIRYSMKRGKIGLYVENMWDVDYQQQYGYPGKGINFALSMEWIVF
jgi:outer membrane cobalamin receptor